ncbi:hypothetical protein BH20ACI3_BH20ACI3_22270 [soil metagenome]
MSPICLLTKSRRISPIAQTAVARFDNCVRLQTCLMDKSGGNGLRIFGSTLNNICPMLYLPGAPLGSGVHLWFSVCCCLATDSSR